MGAPAELAQVLDEEFAALLAADAAAFDLVLARKKSLLESLAFSPQGLTPSEILRLERLNARNADALAPRMLMNSARLQALLTAAGQAPVYGADGTLTKR
jgi:flagellar biosynthesis/type III secretory pathway chaperone